MDDLESLDSETLMAKIKAMNEGMQDSLLQMIRHAFRHEKLNLDRDKIGSLDVVSCPPFEGDDEEDQKELDEDYRKCLALAMPMIRYIIPEVYTLAQQKIMFQYVKDNANRNDGPNSKETIPVNTVAGVIMYSPGVLDFVLDNPFNSLDEDDHRMLVVFRITLNL